MGAVLRVSSGDVTFTLDLARDDSWLGRRLAVQVLRPGTDAPVVPLVQEFLVGDLVTVTVPIDLADGDWVLLRIADPTQPNGSPGPAGHPGNDLGIAYTSPWWLEPSIQSR
jgi:hypothetical protein